MNYFPTKKDFKEFNSKIVEARLEAREVLEKIFKDVA